MVEKMELASCNEFNGLVYRVANGDCRAENEDVISICMGSTSADIEGANNEMLKKFPIIAISEELGLPEEQSLKIGSFGSGMRKGEVCGACTGALMVLGLKYDHSKVGDIESKLKTDEVTDRFLDEFKLQNWILFM